MPNSPPPKFHILYHQGNGQFTNIVMILFCVQVMAISSSNMVNIWDVNANKSLSGKCCLSHGGFTNLSTIIALSGHEDTVQSINWNGIGSQLASICKVRRSQLRMFIYISYLV